MPPLRELQQGFSDALFGAEGSAPPFAIAGPADSLERMAIYRRAVFANYRNALAATYPVVKRLVGAPFFNAAADAFVRAHPSTSGDLNVYGSEFGDFLASYPYATALAYLPDVARLEWAIDEANRAPDACVMGEAVLAVLAAIAPERLPAVRLRLEPTVRLVGSAHPILRIWQVNQPDFDGDDRVALDAGGDSLIVRRGPDGITLARLAAGEHAWLVACAAGADLGTAIDAAQQADDAFDFAATLNTHIAAGTIATVATD